jgi:Mrp family chromosome partitioning ATPase
VIDTPAATEYADAALMATWVDALLVVVDATRSRAGTVLHAMDMLTRAHGTIAGVVLNRVQARDHTVDGTVSSQQTWTGNHRQAEPVGLQNETQEHPFDTVAVEPHSTRDGNLPELTPTAGS